MAAIPQRIQIRRDIAANWTTVNPILASGELGFETNTLKLKIGDGVALWNALSYAGADGGSLTNNGDGTYTWSPASGPNVVFGDLSADVGNVLKLGADFKPMLDPADLVQASAVLPAAGAQTGAIGVATVYARADHRHAETLTTLVGDAVAHTLTFTDEAGAVTVHDLAALTTEIYVDGASFNATTGVLTLTDNNGASPDVTVNLGALTGTLTDNLDGTYTYATPGGSLTFNVKEAAVSVDANNVLILGADGLPYFAGQVMATVAGAALGTAAIGVSTKAAREDHVHTLPEFKDLAALPALPATTQLVGITAAGVVTYYDGIDGGGAA